MGFYPNPFWFARAQHDWPEDRDDTVYLGRAVCRIGQALHAESWNDQDFMYLGASDPDPFAASTDAVARFLAISARRRNVATFQAGQRAAAVAAYLLDAAFEQRLVLVSRHLRRGGDWQAVSHLKIDRSRSFHIFRRCAFDPSAPFDGNARMSGMHGLFVSRTSLERLVRCLPGPRVCDDTLARWVEQHTGAMTQGQIIAASRTAFPNHRPPTQDEVKRADAVARAATGRTPRRRGNPGRDG